jgi:hypothetical protein
MPLSVRVIRERDAAQEPMSSLKPYQGKIIVLLTRQELLIAEIYRFFAGLYPETREFWDNLSREQMDYASWMEYLYKKAQSGSVQFSDDKIRTYTIESFLKYLEDNLARVKEKAPALQGAFSLALAIENSLIVRRAFDHFQSSDRELTVRLNDLREKLKIHRSRVEDISRERAGAGTRRVPSR